MYSKEIIQNVKEYAGYLLKPDQIAILVGIDQIKFKELLRDKKKPISIAYETGKVETILALRKQEIELAKLGSPMAIDLVNKYAIEQKQGER